MAETARDVLVAAVKRLHGCPDYSDLTITCGTDVHKVHKAIVCSRSEFFRRAERFAIGQGAANDRIDLPEDEPQVVKLLIQYIYEGEYDPRLPEDDKRPQIPPVVLGPKHPPYHYKFPHSCRNSCPSPDYKVCPHHSCCEDTCHDACLDFICKDCCKMVDYMNGNSDQLVLHAKMYEIADKYDVDGLEQLAQEKLRRSCNSHWDTKHFAPAAHYAFSTTPESDMGLRDIVVDVIADHIDMLNSFAVEALLTEFNGVAVALLKRNAKAIGWTIPVSTSMPQ